MHLDRLLKLTLIIQTGEPIVLLRLILLLIVAGWAYLWTGPPAQAQPKPVQPAAKIGSPRLVRQINLSNFGSWVVRYGDLDGDGAADALFVQNYNRRPSCLTAINLRGQLLWQIGTPNPKGYSVTADLPVQIYDWNGDGRAEVLIIIDRQLKILDGVDGRLLEEQPVPASDSIYLLPSPLNPAASRMLIKSRYDHVWMLDSDLQPQWDLALNTGHFPAAHDFNLDGVPELLVGYSLLDFNGAKLWEYSLAAQHSDSEVITDLNADGLAEIAIAASGDLLVLDSLGQLLWRKKYRHAQHVAVGRLSWAAASKQIAVVERGKKGRVFGHSASGRRLWSLESQGFFTALSTVKGWTGRAGEDLLLIYRRWMGPPILVDGRGHEVARFEFPPAQPSADPFVRQHFVQHFDALGDGREELLINNEKALWIYTNAAQSPRQITVQEGLPNPRIYNATFYVGMQ